MPEILYWHWFVLAIALLTLEIMAPGVFFLWMSAAATIVAVALLAEPSLNLPIQGIIFAVVSVATIAAWHLYFKGKRPAGENNLLGKRNEQLIGKVFNLSQAIVNGRGKARVGDSHWIAAGNEDLPEGTTVKVVSVDGIVLNVEAVN